MGFFPTFVLLIWKNSKEGTSVPSSFYNPVIQAEYIRQLVERKIEGSDRFIVDVTVSPSNKITILLDADTGILISDCTEVSRYVENALDRNNEDFELEVSSAGADRPLRMPRQYMKNTGRLLDFTTHTGKTGTGRIKHADPEELVLEEKIIQQVPGKKKKEAILQEIRLPYEEIKKATIQLKF